MNVLRIFNCNIDVTLQFTSYLKTCMSVNISQVIALTNNFSIFHNFNTFQKFLPYSFCPMSVAFRIRSIMKQFIKQVIIHLITSMKYDLIIQLFLHVRKSVLRVITVYTKEIKPHICSIYVLND